MVLSLPQWALELNLEVITSWLCDSFTETGLTFLVSLCSWILHRVGTSVLPPSGMELAEVDSKLLVGT